MKKLVTAFLAIMAAVAATGCTGDDPPPSLTVFAAASLTETFTELGERFEAEHGVAVEFNFAGSSALAQQITNGAPVDVFASASPVDMGRVAQFTVNAPVVFAVNRLTIAVPPGNPGGVTGLVDFADPDLTLAVCAEEVPCGRAAAELFGVIGVTAEPDTLEQNVKAVLTKVVLGEVDAGLVYRTDVVAAGDDVEEIEIAEADRVVNDYPIAALASATNRDAAEEFVDFVVSHVGGSVFTDAGFDAP